MSLPAFHLRLMREGTPIARYAFPETLYPGAPDIARAAGLVAFATLEAVREAGL